jgi:hypothetical protein
LSEPPPPGSPEAIAQGCICEPARNFHGAGAVGPMGRLFYPENDCPLHGPARIGEPQADTEFQDV